MRAMRRSIILGTMNPPTRSRTLGVLNMVLPTQLAWLGFNLRNNRKPVPEERGRASDGFFGGLEKEPRLPSIGAASKPYLTTPICLDLTHQIWCGQSGVPSMSGPTASQGKRGEQSCLHLRFNPRVVVCFRLGNARQASKTIQRRNSTGECFLY